MKVIGSPPQRIECLPSELKTLREKFPPASPSAITGVIGDPFGVPIHIVMPKGYPSKVTPRPRKKGRRR